MITKEDKVAIKEAIVEAWGEIRRRRLDDERQQFLNRPHLKDLISLLHTPKPQVDEKQPH